MKKHRFGIDMKKWCREHEAKILSSTSSGPVTDKLLAEHREKIQILQHERLVHLIVTVMVVAVEMLVVYLVLMHQETVGIVGAIVMLALAVLLGFYFYHYFFLENTVQRWYLVLNEMETDEGE